jgi:Sulfatase
MLSLLPSQSSIWKSRSLWSFFGGLVIFLMVLQVSARIALQATFYRDSLNIEQALISHFYGFRFDLRLACLVAGMPLLAGIVPWLNRWIHPVAGSVFGAQGKMNWFWPLAASTVVGLWSLLVYADFGNMAYWQQRLNVGVLFLLRDLETNTRVLWDSYPVIVLALCTTTLMLISYLWVKSWANRLARNALEQPSEKKQPLTTLKAGLLNLSLISLVIFFIHGRWSQYPLRWSDLVRVGHPAAEQLAINPVQNIADTLAYRKPQFDRQATLSAYPHMAPWLGVPAAQTKPLNFSRTPPARSQPIIPRDANVVLVILESFSGYKSSLHGNKLDPTPKLKELADQGWWFHRFGSAHPLTARGVYSIITSRPDVSAGDTASRNPQAILHRSLIADWKEHQPYYFIGGSTSWANVRGLLTKAVPGIKIYEEENLKTPRTDVWGLSDRNLFYESLAILNQHVIEKQTPFFAVIQTAANHRPYTIPGDDQEFRVSQTSEAEALAHGMIGGMSELNAIRLMDHSVAKFMERARQSTWFDNTVFVFLGDHGTIGPVPSYMPSWLQAPDMATIHTPLIIYAPKFIQPKQIDTLGQQADVLPTLLDITGRSAELRGMGRSLLSERPGQEGLLASFHVGGAQYGWFDGRYYAKKIEGSAPGQVQLFDLSEVSKHQLDLAQSDPERARRLGAHLEAYYQTARYLVVHP